MERMSSHAWKVYFFLYLWISMGTFVSLTDAHARPFLFYTTLTAFSPTNFVWHVAAIFASVLSLASLLPIYANAFSVPLTTRRLLQGVFFLRIGADLCGHNYEILLFRSTAAGHPSAAILAVAVVLVLLFPSYKALFDHAFRK